MNNIIFLYIKEVPSGLKYLGVTTKDPYKYLGSGKYWMRHINKYKYHSDIKTTIVMSSVDKDIISYWGLYYSKFYNVVESKEWANLIPENGVMTTLGIKMPESSRLKLSMRMKESFKNGSRVQHNTGQKHSEKTKRKIGEKSIGRIFSVEDRLRQSLGQYKKVYQYDLNHNFIKEWDSVKEAREVLKINNISQCCNKRLKTSGNFIWSYSKLTNE